MSAGDPTAQKPRRLHLAGWLLAGYWALLFVATHLPQPLVEGTAPEGSDIALHLIAYGVLGVLLWRALPSSWGLWGKVAVVLGVCAAYGAVDELTQTLPGINRSGDVKDWLANLAGATLACVGCWAWAARPPSA